MLAAIAVIAGGVALYERNRVKVHEVRAEIIYLDPATRTWAVEYIHPRTGQAVEFNGPASAPSDTFRCFRK